MTHLINCAILITMVLDLSTDADRLLEAFYLALCIWREARGEPLDAKAGVAWSIKNRADHPSWWGKDLSSVVTKPFQYSSFNKNDPNSTKLPSKGDLAWEACVDITNKILDGTLPDPTNGATHYFDKSLDNNPPLWAKEFLHTVDIGRLHFYNSRQKP